MHGNLYKDRGYLCSYESEETNNFLRECWRRDERILLHV